MTQTPCIICVAITGSLPQKSDNPAVPISVAEQVESTHEAFEAGASIVHAHVRHLDGRPRRILTPSHGCWKACATIVRE